MYKIIVESTVKVTEEVEILTEYGDYYDSFTDEVDDVYLLKKLQFVEEDNLAEYIDNQNIKNKIIKDSISTFFVKDNQLFINTEFITNKRLNKDELEELKNEVSGSYSDGKYENGIEKNIFNGKKYKDYYLSVNFDNVTIKQIKINA